MAIPVSVMQYSPRQRQSHVAQHSVDFLIEKIMSAPGKITLVCIGPLTNVAVAIRKEPRILQAVKEVVIMGGAIRHQGNTTPLAEFNVYVDPHAAHMVYHSGMPITLVPLDVTYQCILTQADVERLQLYQISDIQVYSRLHPLLHGIPR